jgi:hypothetical protein
MAKKMKISPLADEAGGRAWKLLVHGRGQPRGAAAGLFND